MIDSQTGRMLLSHNFDLADKTFALNREEFTQVFINELAQYSDVSCSQIDHPHWIVEIIFSNQKYSPSQIGIFCAHGLETKRKSQISTDDRFPDILILGGRKTTPPLSDAVNALQPNQWGVDVVETHSAEIFLAAMEWEEKTAGKTPDDVFKVEKSKG
jgi:hypothetical protein